MRWHSILLTVLILTTAGCSRKTFLRPPDISVPAADRWTAADPLPGEVRGQWWITFSDKGLNAAIEEALDRNYDLRAAAARIAAATAQARIAGAALRPQVSASLSRARQKQNFIGFPIPGAEGRVLTTTFTNAGASLDISWEADLWGRIRAGKFAAVADLEASREDLRGTKLSIAAQTAKAWFAATETHQQVALAEATVENYRKNVASVRARYERGLAPSLDLRLAQSDLLRAQALREERKAQGDRSVRQLEILVGRYPKGNLIEGGTLPQLPEPIPAGLPADLVNRRPDLVAAERRLLAASARAREAKGSLYPSFTLTTSGSYVDNKLSDILRGDFQAWSLIGGLLQRIYEGGRLRATVKLNLARSEEAEAVFAQAVLNAYREVETALAAEQIIERRLHDLEASVEQALAARKLAEDRYRGGLVDIITVLSSQRSALDAENSLLAVRRQLLDNRVDLHLALGGGFENASGSRNGPNANASDSAKETNPS